MERKLVAALACRMKGSRLYGKPLQNLNIENSYTILDNIISLLKEMPCISEIVLGISDEPEDIAVVNYAKNNNIKYILGAEKDALARLIACAEHVKATDVYRVTTECPFVHYELIEKAWETHIAQGNDVTVTDDLPEGAHFEIYTLEALKQSHLRGEDRHRGEFCSLYIREHVDQFKVQIILPEPSLRRTDLRLTVDYPEDLALCRKVFDAFKHQVPFISIANIISYLDKHPQVQALVKEFVEPEYLWQGKCENENGSEAVLCDQT